MLGARGSPADLSSASRTCPCCSRQTAFYMSHRVCHGKKQSTLFSRQQTLLIMTPTPSIEILAQENILQKHKERVERLSQQDCVIKICTDAGLLKTVAVGQNFMTKDTDEFSQYTQPVACRE